MLGLRLPNRRYTEAAFGGKSVNQKSLEPAFPPVAPTSAPQPKPQFEEPRLTFIEPKLTDHGSLVDVTAGFFGTFTP